MHSGSPIRKIATNTPIGGTIIRPRSPFPSGPLMAAFCWGSVQRSLEEVAGFERHDLLRCIESRADRIAALLHDLDLLSEHPAAHADPFVRGCQVLLRMKRDRPLSDLRLVIARQALMLFFGQLGPALAV